jgi:CRP-like cAMP-binding protein
MSQAPLSDSASGFYADASPLAVLRKNISGMVRSIAPDQHVSNEGARRNSVIGVISGLLRCFRVTPDGRRHVTRFVRPGGIIGLGSHALYRNSAEAVTASKIVTFSAATVDSTAEHNACVRNAVLTALTEEMSARDRIQFRLGRLWADERVADFLLELSEEAGGDAASGSICMSRSDVADHLGVTVETVSRALQRFQKLGLVQMEGAHRFTIPRRGDLRGIASGDGDHYPQTTKGSPRDRAMCAA